MNMIVLGSYQSFGNRCVRSSGAGSRQVWIWRYAAELLLLPKKSGKLIWVRTVIQLPLRRDYLARASSEWDDFPCFDTAGHWTIGALAKQFWSVAGSEATRFNQFMMQIFITTT